MRGALLALLLVASSLPLPGASAASWSVDAVVGVTSATTADYTWKISGITHTRLTLPLPANSTFIEARDVDGRALVATASATEVTVSSGARPFVILFALTAQVDGPFSIFPAQVASAPDSAVTVGVTLPAGWTLAGYRDNDEDDPDAKAVFHKTGPSFVQFLALAPGHAAAGPDPQVVGRSVLRSGSANVSAAGADWSLVTTYDTDVFGREWEVHVPPGASNVRASTPWGPLPTVATAEGVKVHTPYPVGFGLGGRSFTVSMTLPAATTQGGAFRQANLSIRAAEGDDVRLTARVVSSAQYAGSRVGGGEETAPLTFVADGPLSVGIAFLPPPAPGHVQFREGRFVVDVPREDEAAARATARNATELLPIVASFAHDANDTRPFFVSYTDADIFHWEEGFYSNGLNTISMRASTLRNATDGKPHLVPVGILIHEATHGLIDRALPDAPHDLSFLHEGLSRLAETRTEGHFPDEVVTCRTSAREKLCDRHSARPGASDIQARYQSGASFDASWKATAVPDEARGALYDYSGMVLNAYAQFAPERALENALLHVARTQFSGSAPQDSADLTDILLANAPGTTAQALFYPGAQAAQLPADQFRHCLSTLVAPPYEWETVRAPPGGCPSMGYGVRDAALPPPPTLPTPPESEPTPTQAAPSPRPSPPETTVRPTGDTVSTDPGTTEGASLEDPSDPAHQPVKVEVPMPAMGALLALLSAIAFARRQKR